MNIVTLGIILIWHKLLIPILCFSPVLTLNYMGITCVLEKGRVITILEFKTFLGLNLVLLHNVNTFLS